MKSEPCTFGLSHLQKAPNQTSFWDGVRNYQARNFIRDGMKLGDLAFFYHSNCQTPGIVAIMEIVKTAYPDATAWDPTSKYHDPKSTVDNPRWMGVDVHLKQVFSTPISLSMLRQHPVLETMLILRKGNRLSITPITPLEWETVLSLQTEVFSS